MKTILTKRLLGHLIKRGYKYCLSKTSLIDQGSAQIGILLKPVKKHPLLQKLPKPYEKYFNISEETLKLASGAKNTEVTVELSEKDLEHFGAA